MNDKEMYQHVKQIVAQKLSVEESQVSLDANFVDDLGADSLDQVELVMALEEEFETNISDEDAQKLMNVGDVVTYLTKYHEAKSA